MAMTLRLDDSVHERAVAAAAAERISMHALIQRAVDHELARLDKAGRVADAIGRIRVEDRELLDRLGS